MTPDPIVEEVRTIRDQIAKECGYDVDAYFNHLRELGATSSAAQLTLSPRVVPAADQESPAPVSSAA